jgi:hypothetical protein
MNSIIYPIFSTIFKQFVKHNKKFKKEAHRHDRRFPRLVQALQYKVAF